MVSDVDVDVVFDSGTFELASPRRLAVNVGITIAVVLYV